MKGNLYVSFVELNNLYQLVYYDNSYFHFYDASISAILGILMDEYKKVLKDNGGIYYPESKTTYFKNKEDAIQAKDEITSIIMMESIVGEIIWWRNRLLLFM